MEPTLRYQVGSIVVPGDRLGTIRQQLPGSITRRIELQPGPGTYSRGGQIYASITGSLQTRGGDSEPEQASNNNKSGGDAETLSPATVTISVLPNKAAAAAVDGTDGFRATKQVVRQGQTVLARVVRIATQMIMVDIYATERGGLLQHDKPAGVIRREDVKAVTASQSAEQQSVTNAVLTQYCRPGDWVVAKVLSLGDTRRYFLSTAEAGLGVIHAVSATSGQPMIPVSWKEMECPDTGVKEARKCARPPKIPEALIGSSSGQQEEVPTPMDEGE